MKKRWEGKRESEIGNSCLFMDASQCSTNWIIYSEEISINSKSARNSSSFLPQQLRRGFKTGFREFPEQMFKSGRTFAKFQNYSILHSRIVLVLAWVFIEQDDELQRRQLDNYTNMFQSLDHKTIRTGLVRETFTDNLWHRQWDLFSPEKFMQNHK